jgi:sulfite reductase (NADPH) hemoprotein beta-component
VGPSFSAAEVPEVIEAVLDTYRRLRQSPRATGPRPSLTRSSRVGLEPFKAAANAARVAPLQAA